MDDDDYLAMIASIMRNAGRGAQRDLLGNLVLNGVPICDKCLGPTSSAGWKYCFPCEREGPRPVPRIFFLTYSGITDQSASDMMNYKGAYPAAAAVLRLRVLLYFGLKYHATCMAGNPDGFDVVTFVPSGKTRLSAINGILPEMSTPIAHMQYVQPFRDGRAEGYELTKFIAEPALFSGKRVLLVEDSWFKGYNARSAAAALYAAGATEVTILVLARRLGHDFPAQARVIQATDASLHFDPTFCPVTLTHH